MPKPAAPEFKPFPPVTSQYLRNLVEAGRSLERRKDDLFAARDKADEDLTSLGDGQPKKREHILSSYGSAVRELATVNKQLRWVDREIRKAVEQADEPGLYDSAEVELPSFDATEESGGDEDAADEPDDTLAAVLAQLPGEFIDQDGRDIEIKDRKALEELIFDRVGPTWHASLAQSAAYGSVIEVRKKAGRGKVVYSLRKTGEVG